MSQTLKPEQWYDENFEINKKFERKVMSLIEEAIEDSHIRIHTISSRVKEKDSFLKKFESKGYDNFDKMTDIVGVRIITNTKADVDRIQKLVEDEFDIDKDNSSDKQQEMEEDKVGYLSVHYIAKIKPQKASERDVRNFKEKVLEIQIRTLLQHSWAVINHAYNYKLSGVLPPEMARKFYLIAGTLELIDQDFQQLLVDVENYSKQVEEDTKQGKFDNEIDSVSLFAYLSQKFNSYNVRDKSFAKNDNSSVEKLNAIGIKTISDLDNAISQRFDDITNMPLINFSKVIEFLLADYNLDISDDTEKADMSDSKKAPFHFHRSCIKRIETHLEIQLEKEKTTTYFNSVMNIGLTCAVSKNYLTFENALYWFAFHKSQANFLEKFKTAYVSFACGNSDTIFVISYQTFLSNLDKMSISHGDEENRKYWHVKIQRIDDKYFMLTKGDSEPIDITKFKI